MKESKVRCTTMLLKMAKCDLTVLKWLKVLKAMFTVALVINSAALALSTKKLICKE